MMDDLENKRLESEKREEEIIVGRREKLKGRPTANLGPYQLSL